MDVMFRKLLLTYNPQLELFSGLTSCSVGGVHSPSERGTRLARPDSRNCQLETEPGDSRPLVVPCQIMVK